VVFWVSASPEVEAAREGFWTVLTDPAGLPYCITDRDPAAGDLG
jgi:hypothetical protein